MIIDDGIQRGIQKEKMQQLACIANCILKFHPSGRAFSLEWIQIIRTSIESIAF